jgi:hypothetical protein
MRPKLTYANVVATLALFVAVGGASAFAASHLGKNSVGSKQIKKNAVTTAKIKKEAITAAKIKKGTLTGTQINASTLGTVPTATTATNATNATTATTAESASPTVFAHVEEGGTVDASLSKGLTSADVKPKTPGVYCITVPSFTPRGGQVTTEFDGWNAQSATITIGGTGSCPAPAVQVVTTKIASPGTESAILPFFVELYR